MQATETTYPSRSLSSLSLRFVAGVLAVFVAAMLIFFVVMSPPLGELRAMALFLSATAFVSIAAGYGVYRLGWIHRAPSISLSLGAIYALSSLVTFLNVYVTARLMFASQHDLLLATILLIFAGGIAMVLGYFLSTAVTEKVAQLGTAAQEIAAGRLSTRVAPQGQDEIANLARTFNQMAEKLAEADRKQREAEQLRRDLLAWVGHDLRTPLTSMRAIVEALSDGLVTDPATVQRYLHTMKRDIGNLDVLIDDLFEMAQIDAGGLVVKKEPNSLVDLISDTLESFSALAQEKRVILSGEAISGVDPVWMDPKMIGRVLTNLLGNAIRHTPSGGSVDLQVELDRSAEWVTVSVTDTGEGIDGESLPRVFEQFYRAEKSRNRNTGGSGLGLAISKGIIEAHGGEIGVESVPGQGARFYFTLPRYS